MLRKVTIELSESAASVLRHWLETVPTIAVPVTHASERQALADLLRALEWSAPDITEDSLGTAREELLRDAGDWVNKGSTYSETSDLQP